MALSTIDYAERAERAGGGVYFVAEGDREYNTRIQKIIPANPCCDCYSIAKAFTVTAIGVLFDRGLLTPNTKVFDVLGDMFPKDADPAWRDVTLHHVMLHRIGVERDCIDIDNESGETYPKATDYLSLILSAPLPFAPGTYNKYNDAGYYLLSRVVERLCGKDPANLLRPFLTEVMGFREFAWSVCPQGYCMGATGLYLRTEDVLKLGILYLNGGEWKGQRLISEEWVKIVLREGYEFKEKGNGWYGKGGMRGQMLTFNPTLGRAVAWHGFNKVPYDAMIQETD